MVARLTFEQRWENFWERVDVGLCWEWTGPTNAYGYGQAQNGALAHRQSWVWLVGPIPTGHILDHLCLNHRCLNTDHLEPVTRAENTRRGHRHPRH